MTRPRRSLLIGDTDHYFSPYIHGVATACGRMGIWHSQVSIRSPIDLIRQRVRDVRPDLLWTHMLMWAPQGSPPRGVLLDMCADARKQGARVLIHDGDVKAPTRNPVDISAAADLALCNHQHDRSAWRIPQIKWPYAAFPQDRIADHAPEWACDLFFAGMTGGGTYNARTHLIERIRAHGIDIRTVDPATDPAGNTMLRTPEIAASTCTVLGFGRPEVPGWTDTRVFQWPGAGAVLLHDDVQGYLEPGHHFVPYVTGDADSIADALDILKARPDYGWYIREKAFAYVQEKHSYVARVREVLAALDMPAS